VYSADILFFPYIDPERARVSIEAPAGTPLEQTDRLVREIEGLAERSPASLKHVEATAGRYGGSTASHRGTVEVIYEAYNERDIAGQEAARILRERVGAITGAKVKVHEASWGPPTGDDVSFEVSGADYAVIGEIGQSIQYLLEEYDAFKEVDSDFEASQPEYRISVDRGRAAHHGVSTAEVADTIRTAINGSVIGSFRHEGEEYDIVLRYQEGSRNSLGALRNLEVVSGDTRIPLSAVADVSPGSSVSVIKRRNLNRAVNVWANFDPAVADRERVIREIDEHVAKIEAGLPPGYSIGAGAGFDVRDESTDFLVQAYLLAVFLIFVVLIAQFNSLADPFIIMFSMLLSLGGVVWGFFIGGQSFVIIMSGIGCIALAGVVVNNCIVLVDYTHRLVRGGMPWGEAIIEAGRTRLRPVLLTALTTVLALVPMAFGFSFDIHSFRFIAGSESAEFWRAFSWTMLYGLSFATIMTLVVVPSLLTLKYRLLERRGGLRPEGEGGNGNS
jgi:multidrug efflux pump subunit AcrB